MPRDIHDIRTGWVQAMGDNEWYVNPEFPEVAIQCVGGTYRPAKPETGEPIGGQNNYFGGLNAAANWLFNHRELWFEG